jgi:hypothetical protein
MCEHASEPATGKQFFMSVFISPPQTVAAVWGFLCLKVKNDKSDIFC